MEIAPHSTFEFIRPDEVAECWDGIPDDLYRALWRCVDHFKGPTPEEAEEPIYGQNAVEDFWHLFTDEEKTALNAAAEAQDYADYDEHQPDEAQEWESYDPDC